MKTIIIELKDGQELEIKYNEALIEQIQKRFSITKEEIKDSHFKDFFVQELSSALNNSEILSK